MRKKKLAAMTVGAALLAAQMAMPVMAASGEIDVNVTTKTGVLRVEVPTKMAVAVNQFEIGDQGSQITSDAFDITNKSEMPVKVKVDSVVTLGTDVSLVSTKAAAEESTSEAGEVWLAAAVAKVETDGSYTYDDPTTDTAGEDEEGNTVPNVPETLATLTEANANVGTFSADKALSQTFYLDKGSMADGNTTDYAYNAVVATEAGKFDVSYASFYELTSAGSITNTATLRSALADGSVVYELEGDKFDDDTFSYVSYTVHAVYDEDDADTAEYDGMTYEYYTASEEEATANEVEAGDLFIYSEMDTAGGMTSFRYLGKLGAGKETWTNENICSIKIAYDIVGVTETRFGELENGLVNGLYVEAGYKDAFGSISNGKVWIGIDATTGFSAEPTSVTVNGTETSSYTYNAGWVSMATPDAGSVIVLLVDGTYYKVTIS